jgi:hypothetical protein
MKLAAEQPETSITISDGLFIKAHRIARAGTILPQHSHGFSHISGIVSGAVQAYAGDVCLGDFAAPAQIKIEAHVKHLFVTLTDDVTIWCIHAMVNGEEPEIEEEHQIVGAP